MGLKVEERRITAQEWRDDVASGAMTEAFACGTAAVITPVGHVLGDDVDFVVNNNEAGKTTLALRESDRHPAWFRRGYSQLAAHADKVAK